MTESRVTIAWTLMGSLVVGALLAVAKLYGVWPHEIASLESTGSHILFVLFCLKAVSGNVKASSRHSEMHVEGFLGIGSAWLAWVFLAGAVQTSLTPAGVLLHVIGACISSGVCVWSALLLLAPKYGTPLWRFLMARRRAGRGPYIEPLVQYTIQGKDGLLIAISCMIVSAMSAASSHFGWLHPVMTTGVSHLLPVVGPGLILLVLIEKTPRYVGWDQPAIAGFIGIAAGVFSAFLILKSIGERTTDTMFAVDIVGSLLCWGIAFSTYSILCTGQGAFASAETG